MKAKKFLLLIGDIAILFVSLALALTIRYGGFNLATFKQHLIPFAVIYFLWIIVFYIHNLYDIRIAKNNLIFNSALFRSLAINAALAIGFFYLIPKISIAPKTNLFLNIVVFAALFYLWRRIFNLLLGSSTLKTSTAIIGSDPLTFELAKEIISNPQLGYRLRFIIRERAQDFIGERLRGIEIVDGTDNLKSILTQAKIGTVVVAPDAYQSPDLIGSLYDCIPHKIDFVNLPTFYEDFTQRIPLGAINQVWFLENLTENKKETYETAKRITDFIGGLILLTVSFPFWLLIALIIKLDSEGPIFYKQQRVGQGGNLFNIIKFRSMIKDAEKYTGPTWTKSDEDPRITKIGRFLRKTRIDEIPQLWNILKGEMSFVGPRAERPEFHKELEEKIPFYQERYLIKPGLSGWAQIKFRYGSSVSDNFEKLQYDLYYIKNRSFIFDLGIILKTINIVLRGGGR